jgi:hypothetical protein
LEPSATSAASSWRSRETKRWKTVEDRQLWIRYMYTYTVYINDYVYVCIYIYTIMCIYIWILQYLSIYKWLCTYIYTYGYYLSKAIVNQPLFFQQMGGLFIHGSDAWDAFQPRTTRGSW